MGQKNIKYQSLREKSLPNGFLRINNLKIANAAEAEFFLDCQKTGKRLWSLARLEMLFITISFPCPFFS